MSSEREWRVEMLARLEGMAAAVESANLAHGELQVELAASEEKCAAQVDNAKRYRETDEGLEAKLKASERKAKDLQLNLEAGGQDYVTLLRKLKAAEEKNLSLAKRLKAKASLCRKEKLRTATQEALVRKVELEATLAGEANAMKRIERQSRTIVCLRKRVRAFEALAQSPVGDEAEEIQAADAALSEGHVHNWWGAGAMHADGYEIYHCLKCGEIRAVQPEEAT